MAANTKAKSGGASRPRAGKSAARGKPVKARTAKRKRQSAASGDRAD